MLADEDEDESENDDQSESQIQPQNSHSQTNPPQNEPRRSTRVSKKPQTMYDPSKYKSERKVQKSNSSTSAITTQINYQTLPLYKSIGANLHSGNHFSFETELALISHSTNVPISYKQATSPELVSVWRSAIDKEHDSLLLNHTWTLIKRLPGMNVLPSKYVFRMKSSGPKARLVALGLLQVHGVDYMETYAPVVNIITVRMLFALVATMDFELDQMDVVTAFLYGDLDEDIYMEVPEGLRDSKHPDLV